MMQRRVISVVLASLTVAGASAFAARARADEAACIAASESALTLRKDGKLHATLAQLAICSDLTCSEIVRTECTKREAQVQAAMPTLIFAAKDGSGNDLVAVTVTMDGAPFASTLDGLPIAVDPGSHAFHFEAKGVPSVDKTIVLREGDAGRHETVTLGSPPPAPPTAPAPSSTVAPSSWSTQKSLAVVSAGVGVVGIALGAVFGGLAISDKNQETSNCSSTSCSNRPQASEDYDTAKKNGTVSTVGFIAGGVFLAGGAVLWFTAPKTKEASSASAIRGEPSVHGLRLVPSFDGRSAGLSFAGDM